MLKFEKLTLDLVPQLRSYFDSADTRACDDTVGGTFMWRDMFDTEYALYDGSVVFKAVYTDGTLAFSYPLGGDEDACLDEIVGYCDACGIPCKFVFVTEKHMEILNKKFKCRITHERDWSDYVYNISDLAEYPGRKYGGQRNHKNAFTKQNPTWHFDVMTEKNIPDALDFYRRLPIYQRCGDKMFEEDKAKTEEVLCHLSQYGMTGGVLYGDEGVCAFCVGEVKGDTLYVHAEKADAEKRGAYQTVVSEFARYIMSSCPEVRFVNREEDQGQEGLRTSKLSYHPCFMMNKYTVECE